MLYENLHRALDVSFVEVFFFTFCYEHLLSVNKEFSRFPESAKQSEDIIEKNLRWLIVFLMTYPTKKKLFDFSYIEYVLSIISCYLFF